MFANYVEYGTHLATVSERDRRPVGVEDGHEAALRDVPDDDAAVGGGGGEVVAVVRTPREARDRLCVLRHDRVQLELAKPTVQLETPPAFGHPTITPNWKLLKLF